MNATPESASAFRERERLAKKRAKYHSDPEHREQERKRERDRKRLLLSNEEYRLRYRAGVQAWRHGLTREELAILKARGACDVCATTKPGGQGFWHIDHDHDTGAVRGLLCFTCNTRIVPTVESHDQVIDGARRYLANPPGIRGHLTAVAK